MRGGRGVFREMEWICHPPPLPLCNIVSACSAESSSAPPFEDRSNTPCIWRIEQRVLDDEDLRKKEREGGESSKSAFERSCEEEESLPLTISLIWMTRPPLPPSRVWPLPCSGINAVNGGGYPSRMKSNWVRWERNRGCLFRALSFGSCGFFLKDGIARRFDISLTVLKTNDFRFVMGN